VKTASNSSVPPSKSWKAGRPAPEAGQEPVKRGPPVGHPGASREWVPLAQVDQVVACRSQRCADCGSSLPEMGGRIVGQRQMIDLPPSTLVVTEAQVLAVWCPHCQQETVGSYPEGFRAVTHFGPRVLALAAWLHEEHHVAYARMTDLFRDAFGLRISEGALVAAVGRLGYQICLAHQLRDLEYARQRGDGLAREWARATHALLRRVVRLCH